MTRLHFPTLAWKNSGLYKGHLFSQKFFTVVILDGIDNHLLQLVHDQLNHCRGSLDAE
jgi:hypothetical protein